MMRKAFLAGWVALLTLAPHAAQATTPGGDSVVLGQPAAPRGMVVYLDGDGMDAHDHPDRPPLGGPTGIVAEAEQRGFITLSIRTPATDNTFWTDLDANADHVNQVIRQVTADREIKTVVLVGYSGGAQLITKALLPHHPDLCTGGVMVAGGGGKADTVTQPPATRCPLLWATGTSDTGATSSDGYNALNDARRGATAYAAAGWDALIWTPEGVDHATIRTQLGRLTAYHLDHAAAAAS